MEKKRFTMGIEIGCLLLTLGLLVWLALYWGESGTKSSARNSLEVQQRFAMNSVNAMSDNASGAMNMEKKYWIATDAIAAPKPNRECFGKTDDPAVLRDVIQRAEKLLSGQKLYFSPDVTLVPNSVVHYYLDETILAITWKQPIDGTVFSFSEVKIADPSQFRRFLTEGKYGSGTLSLPTEMASSVHSVVASSGDYYQFRDAGVIVYEGKACRVGPGADTCYVDVNGDLLFTPKEQHMTLEEAQKFVDDNKIWFSLAFGPILVENGEPYPIGSYALGEVDRKFARAALCQMDDLHYLLANANADYGFGNYLTIYNFATRIQETGCKMAYALDGGQTAALMMDGELINQMTNGYQRKISDIIYFGTAIPNN